MAPGTEGTKHWSKARKGGWEKEVGQKTASLMSMPSKGSNAKTKGVVRDKGVEGVRKGRGEEGEQARI